MTRRLHTLATLPLFADDAALGEALMGRGKSVQWAAIAALLEARGLPKIDALMGGRYVPAVIEFFARDNVAPKQLPQQPGAAVENLGAWQTTKHQRRARRA